MGSVSSRGNTSQSSYNKKGKKDDLKLEKKPSLYELQYMPDL